MSSFILHAERPRPTESRQRYERRIAALIGARDVELVASARSDNHIVHCISVSNPGSLRTLNASQKHRIANAHEMDSIDWLDVPSSFLDLVRCKVCGLSH